jgi:hypothetical protein
VLEERGALDPDLVRRFDCQHVDRNDRISDWSAPCFLHYPEDVEYFGERVLPLVRELEADTEESHDRFTTNV